MEVGEAADLSAGVVAQVRQRQKRRRLREQQVPLHLDAIARQFGGMDLPRNKHLLAATLDRRVALGKRLAVVHNVVGLDRRRSLLGANSPGNQVLATARWRQGSHGHTN